VIAYKLDVARRQLAALEASLRDNIQADAAGQAWVLRGTLSSNEFEFGGLPARIRKSSRSAASTSSYSLMRNRHSVEAATPLSAKIKIVVARDFKLQRNCKCCRFDVPPG